MNQHYTPTNVELSPSQMCTIMTKLDPKNDVERNIGQQLAKHVSKEWQQVFNPSLRTLITWIFEEQGGNEYDTVGDILRKLINKVGTDKPPFTVAQVERVLEELKDRVCIFDGCFDGTKVYRSIRFHRDHQSA